MEIPKLEVACFTEWVRNRSSTLNILVPNPRLDGLKLEDSVVELVT